MSKGNAKYLTPIEKIPHPTLTLHNTAYKTFNPGDYRIGVITDENYTGLRSKREGEGAKTIKLPDGRNIHMYPIIDDILYPNSYTSLELLLEPFVKINKNKPNREVEYRYRGEQEIIIRVFTPTGTRDFFLLVKPEENEK